MKSHYLLLLLAVYAGFHSVAADQSGAELRKKPVKVEIVKKGDPQEGNVRVIYADGTSDFWTKKGNCHSARVASDGTVGWVVDENLGVPDLPRAFRSTLILCRKGQVITKIGSGCPVISDWIFLPSGKQLVIYACWYHASPRGDYELYDTATGNRLETVPENDTNLPKWVKELLKTEGATLDH